MAYKQENVKFYPETTAAGSAMKGTLPTSFPSSQKTKLDIALDRYERRRLSGEIKILTSKEAIAAFDEADQGIDELLALANYAPAGK